MATNGFLDIQATPSDRLATQLAMEIGPDYLQAYGITTATTANQEVFLEATSGFRLQLPTSSQFRIEVFYFGRNLVTDAPAPAAPETAIFYPQVNAAGVITLGAAIGTSTLTVASIAAATDPVSNKQYLQLRVTPAAAARTLHTFNVNIMGIAAPPQFMTAQAFSGVRG